MQRYDMKVVRGWGVHGPECVVSAFESEIGRWVPFEDAAKLQDRIDALESELEEIKKQGV